MDKKHEFSLPDKLLPLTRMMNLSIVDKYHSRVLASHLYADAQQCDQPSEVARFDCFADDGSITRESVKHENVVGNSLVQSIKFE